MPSGYANEVGEAFRHMVPVRLVYFSYLISSAYVLSHSVFRGSVARNNLHPEPSPVLVTPPKTLRKVTNSYEEASVQESAKIGISPSRAFLDTLIWQGLASVVIPGLVINRACAGSRLLLYLVTGQRLSKAVRKWAVTGVGLGSIPFIIHPIDR